MERRNWASRPARCVARKEANFSRRRSSADRKAQRRRVAQFGSAWETDAVSFFKRPLAWTASRDVWKVARRSAGFHSRKTRSPRPFSKAAGTRFFGRTDVWACAVSPRKRDASVVGKPCACRDFGCLQRGHIAKNSSTPRARAAEGAVADAGVFSRNRKLDGGRDSLAGAAPSATGSRQPERRCATQALAHNSICRPHRIGDDRRRLERSAGDVADSLALEKGGKVPTRSRTAPPRDHRRPHHSMVRALSTIAAIHEAKTKVTYPAPAGTSSRPSADPAIVLSLSQENRFRTPSIQR